MITLRRAMVAGLETDTPAVQPVRDALQLAIELEHATIPVYLYTVYSLDPAKNAEIVQLIDSVVVEEMLHMVLSANVLNALGGLYADTVSHLRPRVMVQGNPHYLGQAAIVSEIRAVLLAALRSAVLWRQLGGSLWDFVLRRRALVGSVQSQLRL